MSTVSEHLRTSISPAVAAPACQEVVAVTWEIARSAVQSVRPDLVAANASVAPVVLEWRVQRCASGRIEGEARLIDPHSGRRHVLVSTRSSAFRARPGPLWIEDDSMLHVDLPGLLTVSIRRREGRDELLYARTSVLSQLGLPGGRYEPPTLVANAGR